MKQRASVTPNDLNNAGSNSANNGGEVETVENPEVVVENNRVGPNAEVDFSEFLWMEHEEEFDEQVLRELEDEEIFNFYYNLTTEAENDAEIEANIQNQCAAGPAAAPTAGTNGEALEQITTGLSQIGFSGSRSGLNPNAQEFVPLMRQQHSSNAAPASEASKS